MEQGLLEAQSAVKLRDELAEMYGTPTFKEVFLEGYFKEEPARIAQALTNPSMQDDVDQRNLDEMLRAIGHMQNYLLNLTREGNTAEMQIEEWKNEEIKAAQSIGKKMEVDPITGDEYEVDA